ncbi:MAG: hypothetical protein FWC71_06700 [Defluviitaleaceae bacterium]|nr:hypothetical protein [Defluviitaleaceae bacterium]
MNKQGRMGVKRRVALVLAFILLASTVSQFAFGAEGEQSGATYISESGDVSSPAAINVTGGDAVADLSPLEGVVFGATLEGFGQTVDLTQPGATFSGPLLGSFREPQLLTVTAEFTEGSTDRRIEIELANGMGLWLAPGMVYATSARNNWNFVSSNLVGGHLEDVIDDARFVQAPLFEQRRDIEGVDTLINSHQPRAGTLIYYINEDVTSVTIHLYVMTDTAFILKSSCATSNSRFHEDAIIFRAIENNAVIDSAVLEKYILTGDLSFRVARTNVAPRLITRGPGESWVSEFNVEAEAFGVTSGGIANVLIDEVTIVFPVPKMLTGAADLGVRISSHGLTNNQLTEHMFNYTINSTDDPYNHLVTVVFTQARLTSTSILELFGIIPNDAVPGIYISSPLAATGTITPISEGTHVTTGVRSLLGMHEIRVPYPRINRLYVRPMTGGNLFSGRPGVTPIAPLGGFLFQNEFLEPLYDQSVRITFPEETQALIGVRAFRLVAGEDGIANIRAVTSHGRILERSGPFARQGTMDQFPWVSINFYDVPYPAGLASDEFIVELYYEMAGDVPVSAGWRPVINHWIDPFGFTNMFYAGVIHNQIPGGTRIYAHATVGQWCRDTEDGFHPTNRMTSHNVMIASDVAAIIFYTMHFNMVNQASLGRNLDAGGAARNVSFNVNLSRHQHHIPNVSSAQGFYAYLRSPNGLINFDRSTIEVHWNGQIYREGCLVNPLIVEPFVDTTGSRVYRLQMDWLVLGHMNAAMAGLLPAATVRANIYALPYALPGTVAPRDLFFTNIIQDDIEVRTGGSAAAQSRRLDENFHIPNCNRAANGMLVGAPIANQESIRINANATLLTGTHVRVVPPSAALASDAGWISYNWTSGLATLNIEPYSNVQYRLTYHNNTSLSVGSFATLMAIPKAGEEMPGMAASSVLQREPFGFSLSLMTPLVVSSDFEVHYSVLYTTDENDASFADWASIADPADIRMVRIRSAAGSNIPAGDYGEFILDLAVPTIAEALEAGYIGAMNRYGTRIHALVLGTGILRHTPVAMRMWQTVAFHYGTRADATLIPDMMHVPAERIVDIPTAVPLSDGYTFLGWSRNDMYNPGDSFVMPTSNVTFTAMWQRNAPDEFDITYTFTGDVPPNVTTPAPQTNIPEGATGQSATPINPTSVPGELGGVEGNFTFNGWTTADVTVAGDGTFTMPDSNVYFTGSWTFIPATPSETTPSETTPSETTPSETTPSETTPSETTPSETTASETTTSETTPSETTTTETTSSQTTTTTTGTGTTPGTMTQPTTSQPTTPQPTTTSQSTEPPLIKIPSAMNVAVGEYISWTLIGIHNRTGTYVPDFTIVDTPGLGLNFVSGSLPAFYNGAGITFDVRYRVAGSSEWQTFATGVPASAPFTFTLPQPGNLHYTDIRFDFGTVPADFARGDEIVLTFIVDGNAPNNELINHFVVFHGNYSTPGQVPYVPVVRPPVTTTPTYTASTSAVVTHTAPPTVNDNHALVPHGNGYFEVDGEGLPLGQWTWDEAEISWIFDEVDPIAVGFMPQTGVDGNRTIFNIIKYSALFIGGLAVLWFVVHFRHKRAQEK